MNSSRVSKFGLRPTLVTSWTQSRLAHDFSLVPLGKLLTRYEARRIAANHRQARGAAAAEGSVQNRDLPDVWARPSSRARGSGLHADVSRHPPFASAVWSLPELVVIQSALPHFIGDGR